MLTLPWLEQATKTLEKAGIGTARLDCLVLLEDMTGKDRGWLLANPEFEISNEQIKKLDKLVKRRTTHEPLAYIRNKTEFYRREFYIDHHVLEPRPESETMIELLKSLKLSANATIADIGTGSGALAITAKLELPGTEVIATDIDEGCLAVARKNSKNLKADVKFLKNDLLASIYSNAYSPEVVIANLPYVPDHFQINPAAMNEPRIAIFGGSDGLDLYRRLFAQILKARRPTYVLTESMPPQHESLAAIAKAAGYQLKTTDDFIQLFKA